MSILTLNINISISIISSDIAVDESSQCHYVNITAKRDSQKRNFLFESFVMKFAIIVSICI